MRIVMLFILLISSELYAQTQYPETVIPVEKKHILFGGDFGFNFSKLNIKESEAVAPSLIFGDTLLKINQFNEPGVHTGLFIVYPWRIITLRPEFHLNLYRNNLSYELSTRVIDKQLTTLSFALSLNTVTYLSRKKGGIYFLAGLTFEKVKAFWNNVTPSDNYLSGDVGIGLNPLELDGATFISPEITFSFGLQNVNEPSNTPYDQALSSLKRNTLRLSFLIYY